MKYFIKILFSYRMLQESSSSNNLPAFKYEPLIHSGPPHSASTPQLKKKHASGSYVQGINHKESYKDQYKNANIGNPIILNIVS